MPIVSWGDSDLPKRVPIYLVELGMMTLGGFAMFKGGELDALGMGIGLPIYWIGWIIIGIVAYRWIR